MGDHERARGARDERMLRACPEHGDVGDTECKECERLSMRAMLGNIGNIAGVEFDPGYEESIADGVHALSDHAAAMERERDEARTEAARLREALAKFPPLLDRWDHASFVGAAREARTLLSDTPGGPATTDPGTPGRRQTAAGPSTGVSTFPTAPAPVEPAGLTPEGECSVCQSRGPTKAYAYSTDMSSPERVIGQEMPLSDPRTWNLCFVCASTLISASNTSKHKSENRILGALTNILLDAITTGRDPRASWGDPDETER